MDPPLKSLPPLSSLRPFEAAARLQSFTLAAEELGLTQAAISKQIRLLEADLGTPLFERRNRGVFLSAAGRRLGQVVSQALADIATEAGQLRGRSRPKEAVLFCQLCEAFYWLTPRLARFHGRHPEIELRLVSSIRPLIESPDSFDVAIQTSGRPSGSYPLAFTADDEVLPVCAPALLEGAGSPLTLEALCDLPLLSHRVLPQDWIDWDDFLPRVGSALRVGAKARPFDSYPLVLQAAIAGHGVALGWRRTVQPLLEAGTLVRPCRETLLRPREISVFTSPEGRSRPETRALLAWLRDELDEGQTELAGEKMSQLS